MTTETTTTQASDLPVVRLHNLLEDAIATIKNQTSICSRTDFVHLYEICQRIERKARLVQPA